MAFNDLGPRFWIAPGQTLERSYTWHNDLGAQYAMVRLHTPDSKVWSTRQGKQRYDEWWGSWSVYYVTVYNEGPNWAYCSLDGGGST